MTLTSVKPLEVLMILLVLIFRSEHEFRVRNPLRTSRAYIIHSLSIIIIQFSFRVGIILPLFKNFSTFSCKRRCLYGLKTLRGPFCFARVCYCWVGTCSHGKNLNRTNGKDSRVRLRTNFLSITYCAAKDKEMR